MKTIRRIRQFSFYFRRTLIAITLLGLLWAVSYSGSHAEVANVAENTHPTPPSTQDDSPPEQKLPLENCGLIQKVAGTSAQAKFTQERIVSGLSRPLRSSGTLRILSPQVASAVGANQTPDGHTALQTKELVWETTEPIYSQVRVSSAGFELRSNAETDAKIYEDPRFRELSTILLTLHSLDSDGVATLTKKFTLDCFLRSSEVDQSLEIQSLEAHSLETQSPKTKPINGNSSKTSAQKTKTPEYSPPQPQYRLRATPNPISLRRIIKSVDVYGNRRPERIRLEDARGDVTTLKFEYASSLSVSTSK